MSIAFGLGVTLGQSQKLTPQMQQAIKLLQLSSLELEQEVQAKLDSNPLLERVEEEFAEPEATALDDWTSNNWQSGSSDSDGFDTPSAPDGLDKLTEASFDDDAMDMAWQEVYNDDISDFEGHSATNDSVEVFGATSLNIHDHIRWQMNFKHLSNLDKLIAEQLIDAMDDAGFIRADLADIAHHFATLLSFYEIEETVEHDEVLAVLKMIQACSPTGVGARNLSECLLLQLNQLPSSTAYIAEARQVLHCSEHLQNNNIKALMTATGLSAEVLTKAMALIRTLDPSPARAFIDSQNGESAIDVPDVLVIAKDGKNQTTAYASDAASWRVTLNPATLPKLQINQEYASLIKRGDDSDANQYIKHHLQDARLFIRSIEERNQNLLRVATYIVQKQQAFFVQGVQAMQPLTIKQVAESLALHESTVSRLTTNKTMLTPQGLLDFKYFFSSHVQSEEGEISSTAISAMIAEMIEEEDSKKPLSDSKITERLAEQGIVIARRTVAKYREAMGILPSSQRKNKLL